MFAGSTIQDWIMGDRNRWLSSGIGRGVRAVDILFNNLAPGLALAWPGHPFVRVTSRKLTLRAMARDVL